MTVESNTIVFVPVMKAIDYMRVIKGAVVPLRERTGGVLDEKGTAVPESFLNREMSGKQQTIIGLPDPSEQDKPSVVQEDRSVIFAGHHNSHFGHFLLESLSRLWATERLALPIVWTTPYPILNRWQQDILNLLEIRCELLFPRQVTRFKEVIIPRPGLVIDNFLHPELVSFLGKYEALSPSIAESESRKVWLSRSSLKSRDIISEIDLEERLNACGWHIFAPERKSIWEQLDVLGTADVVAGIEGSAFHLLLLLKYPKCKVILVRRTRLQCYRMISEGLGLEHEDLFGHLEVIQGDGYQHTRYGIKSLDTTVAEILRSS